VPRALLALALAVALMLVAGCGNESRQTTTDSSRIPGPNDTLVVYDKSGGEAGMRQRLAVRPDGAARIETNDGVARVDLRPEELDAVRRTVDAAFGAQLEPVYGKEPPPLDSFVTTVLVDTRRVRVLPGGKPPRELQELISVCAAIVRRYEPR
jgi:hypothetical protein